MKETERRNPNSVGIDQKTIAEALRVFHHEDRAAVNAAAAAAPDVEPVVRWAADALRSGGRIVYIGAGTSGRLGVLDASECPPTFGVAPDRVIGIIAGGDDALRNAVEGAEDSPEQGAEDIQRAQIGPDDLLVGVSASGTAPYVLGALQEAKRRGAKTALLRSTPKEPALDGYVDRQIAALTGPEIIAGSTRLKAGAAAKLILNQISTIAMIQTGKVFDNWMINVQPSNRKLRERALKLVMRIAETDEMTARRALQRAGSVKAAVLVLKRSVDPETAERLLQNADGNLRTALSAE